MSVRTEPFVARRCPHGLKTRATGGAHRGTGFQPVRTTPESGSLRAACVTILSLLTIAPSVRAAQEPPAPEAPAAESPAAPRPLLDQLNRETEALYREVRRGLLRVQLPPPRWLDEPAVADSPLVKYKGLDPKVREALARANPPAETAHST